MRAPSLLQPEGQKECYLTGIQSECDLHHIFHGTANRKLSDQWGCWCWLKHDLHRRLHEKDKALDRRLQQECQIAFEKKYSRKMFMEIFGKNYLTEDEEE